MENLRSRSEMVGGIVLAVSFPHRLGQGGVEDH